MPNLQFRKRLHELLDNEPSGKLASRLNEKGVECSIIVPLLEYELGYNPLLDIQYEMSSENRNGQRFDFIVDEKILIEAKALGVLLDSREEKQLRDYITYNDNIICGFLTNGWDYNLYIKKRYIEKKLNESKELGQNVESAIKTFTIPIIDDRFIDVISLFNKEQYEDTLLKIGKYVLNTFEPVQGRSSKICADKDIDSYIKRLIDNTIVLVKGYYYDKVKSGELDIGTTLKYSTRELEIGVQVQSDGTIILARDGIQIRDVTKVMQDYKEFMRLYVNQWSNQDTTFNSPYDIILQGLGRKNKIPGMEKLYPFA